MLEVFLFVVCYLVAANFGVNMGYHRFLAHRSFAAKKWFEYAIVLIGLPAGTPIQWAGNHRAHHRYADTPQDPHSPYYGGFWYAHNGWYLATRRWWICLLYALGGPLRTLFDGWHRPRSNQEYVHLAPDIASDGFFRFLSRPSVFGLICVVHVAVLLGVSVLLFGNLGFVVAWGASVLVYNLGDSVDSIGHLWGQIHYPETGRATDNPVLAWLTFGDGWHSTHHRFPASARHGILPGQFDWTFLQLKLLFRLGVVERLYEVSRDQALAILTRQQGAPTVRQHEEPIIPTHSEIPASSTATAHA